jgi:hypothetical protein
MLSDPLCVTLWEPQLKTSAENDTLDTAIVVTNKLYFVSDAKVCIFYSSHKTMVANLAALKQSLIFELS